MKNKSNILIIISIIIAVLVIFFAIRFSEEGSIGGGESRQVQNINNVSVEDEKQIIKLDAKGGYSPEHSIAKAGMPTILRISTSGTFDCSSIVRIPSLNISKNLPMSGMTDIDLGIPLVGTISGTCGMGMYPFDIKFK